jgi:DNA invertase Pin-like site-specific DNA recombinase
MVCPTPYYNSSRLFSQVSGGNVMRRKAEPTGYASSDGRESMKTTGQRHFLGYSRVSTEEQADRRNGLEAQRAAIDAEAQRRGWRVEHVADEGSSGKYINGSLREALQLLTSGQADGLIAAKLDRLARSLVHAANIIEAANDQRWSLVVLDMNVDLTTASGRLIAQVLSSFAEYEREQISERTRAGLAAKRRRGERIGRPRLAQPGIVRRIVLDRDAGLSFDRIARALTAEGVLSPAGRPTWQSSTVRRIYQSASTASENEEACLGSAR